MIASDATPPVPGDYHNANFYDFAVRMFEEGRQEAGKGDDADFGPSVLPEVGPEALKKLQAWVGEPFMKLQITLSTERADSAAAAFCSCVGWMYVAAHDLGYNLEVLGKAFIQEYMKQLDDPSERDRMDDHKMTLFAMRKAFGFPLPGEDGKA